MQQHTVHEPQTQSSRNNVVHVCHLSPSRTHDCAAAHAQAHAQRNRTTKALIHALDPYRATHIDNLCLDGCLAKVCDLVQQQATASTGSDQQASNGHWAVLPGQRLVGIPQLHLTGCYVLLQALLTTSKATSGTSCKAHKQKQGCSSSSSNSTAVWLETAQCTH